MRPAALALLVSAVAAGCAGCGGGLHERTITVYFEQPGSAARPLQVVPVLAPVERRLAPGTPAVPAILGALERGPTAAEVSRDGLLPRAPLPGRVLAVRVEHGTAMVNLAGPPPGDFDAHGALVYSLTAVPGIERVVLLLRGKPCCVHDMQGGIVAPLTRALYRGWPGEPCAARTYPGAVRCRAS